MKTKYYNDAYIGNKNILSTYSKTGELIRTYYPTPDFRQFIDSFGTGVKINDSGIIYLHLDSNNKYNQYYEEDTNVLVTEIENTYYRLKVKQTDFVSIKNDVIIKHYIFENDNSIDLDVNFLVHSKLISNENNRIGAEIKNNSLIQYCHDYQFAIFSKSQINAHQLNDVENNIQSGIIQDKDFIGMSADSAVDYHIGIMKSGEKKEFTLFLSPMQNENGEGKKKIDDEIEEIRKLDIKIEKQNAIKYWRKFVKDHYKLPEEYCLDRNSGNYIKKINKIYKRSILLLPLLINEETGGMIATAEIDEENTKCGRYAYCWPRDAVFICSALDKIGMTKEAEKFYKVFCKNTQSRDGMWKQRFYTDGKLAPCWGYQIDETASIIYGVYQHYLVVKDEKFIKDTFKMCDNAVKFLERYMDNVLEIKDESDVVKKEIEQTYHTEYRDKLPLSYDLWEMNEGIHLYSISSIEAAYKAMLSIYEIMELQYKENRLKLENIHKNVIRIKKQMEEIPKYVAKNLYDEKTKTLKRSVENGEITDISVIGAITPFEMFGPKEKKVINTVEKINLTLRTYTGGYLRFEGDSYLEGRNPWPISTMWMSMYYQKVGDKKKAKECIEFVINSCNQHGLLGEQVENSTMQPNWAIGLGWSHAMFILAIE